MVTGTFYQVTTGTSNLLFFLASVSPPPSFMSVLIDSEDAPRYSSKSDASRYRRL